jgi:hypothetical protein
VFSIVSGSAFDPIASVTGIDPNRVFLIDKDTLGINFAELSFSFGDSVHITFAEAAAVPIPAALPLFATGLGLMGLVGWRRKRRAPKTVATL